MKNKERVAYTGYTEILCLQNSAARLIHTAPGAPCSLHHSTSKPIATPRCQEPRASAASEAKLHARRYGAVRHRRAAIRNMAGVWEGKRAKSPCQLQVLLSTTTEDYAPCTLPRRGYVEHPTGAEEPE